MKKLIFVLLLLSCSNFVFAQYRQADSRRQLVFIRHWINIGEYEEAISVIDISFKQESSDTAFQDSLNYLKAWCLYHLKELDSSAFYFDNVTASFPLYPKTVFFSAFNKSYEGRYDEAISALKAYNPEDSNLIRLKNFELAGIHLLKRDFERFNSHSQRFDYRYYPIAREEKTLIEHYDELLAFKKKSPLLAGTLSALVPGLGKLYAGKMGEGISAFLVCTSLGLVAYENYRKDGLLDAKTLVFGGVFSAYYIGNIWGSVFTVKIKKQEFNDAVNQFILFDLHIPLRNVFF